MRKKSKKGPQGPKDRTAEYIKGVFVDVGDMTASPKMFVNNLADMYGLLGCDCVDMPMRFIGDTAVRIICDDEGMLCGKKIASAVDSMGRVAFVGNILIVAPTRLADGSEDIRSLNDSELAVVLDHIRVMSVTETDGGGASRRYNTYCVTDVDCIPAGELI